MPSYAMRWRLEQVILQNFAWANAQPKETFLLKAVIKRT